MKILYIIGSILGLLGIVGMAFPEIGIPTGSSGFELGPFSASVGNMKVLNISRVLSGTILSTGLILLLLAYFFPKKNKRKR